MHLGAILFDEVKEESVLVTPVCRSLLSAVPLVCRSFRRWQLFVYHRTFILNAGLKKPKSGDSATLICSWTHHDRGGAFVESGSCHPRNLSDHVLGGRLFDLFGGGGACPMM